MPTLPRISLERVTLGYPGHQHLIESLTYSVDGPALIRLDGQNGSGKTTLLEAIAGHLPTRDGSIRVCNQEALQGRQSAVSFIRTSPALAHGVTMRDHCLLFSTVSSSGIERISQITSALSIQDYLDYVPAQLSSGTRRKFWIALGLLRRTPVLILDEPFNELDAESSTWLLNQLLLEATTRLVILVCHSWPDEYPLGVKEQLTSNLTVAHIPIKPQMPLEHSK